MTETVLGLGDLGVSKTPGDTLKTYALGSCIAVIMFDPVLKAAGMIHVVLPNASIAPEKVQKQPGYFADTGIAALMEKMKHLGSSGRVLIKLAGGAQIADPHHQFNVGKRNALAVKKSLWALRLGTLAEDLGGSVSRTVAVDVATGKTIISNPRRGQWEL